MFRISLIAVLLLALFAQAESDSLQGFLEKKLKKKSKPEADVARSRPDFLLVSDQSEMDSLLDDAFADFFADEDSSGPMSLTAGEEEGESHVLSEEEKAKMKAEIAAELKRIAGTPVTDLVKQSGNDLAGSARSSLRFQDDMSVSSGCVFAIIIVIVDIFFLILSIIGVRAAAQDKVARALAQKIGEPIAVGFFQKITIIKDSSASAFSRASAIVSIASGAAKVVGFTAIVKAIIADLSWWDYTKTVILVVAQFVLWFGTGGAALIASIVMMLVSAVQLIMDVVKCVQACSDSGSSGGSTSGTTTSAWFSEENGGYSTKMAYPISAIACKGSYCDNMQLIATTGKAGLQSSPGYWTNTFSEEGGAQGLCPSNMLVSQIRCTGSYCDNLRLRCDYLTSGYTRSSSITGYSGWFSEEGAGKGTCPTGQYVIGIKCNGSYCDNKYLICAKVSP